MSSAAAKSLSLVIRHLEVLEAENAALKAENAALKRKRPSSGSEPKKEAGKKAKLDETAARQSAALREAESEEVEDDASESEEASSEDASDDAPAGRFVSAPVAAVEDEEESASREEDVAIDELNRAPAVDVAATKAAAAAADLAAVAAGEGRMVHCRDCDCDFLFEQSEEDFYRSKGWDADPVRCKACRAAKKARNMEKDGNPTGLSGGKGACYAFQRGECTRGDSCRFAHVGGGGGGGSGRGRGRGRGRGSSGGRGRGRGGGRGGGGDRPRGECFDFKKGNCTRGAACRFSH